MIRKIFIKIFGGKITNIETIEAMPFDVFASYLFERIIMLLRGLIRFRKLCFVGKGVKLKCKGRIKIGKFVTIHDFSYIDASSENGVVIESYCTIGRNAFIRSGNLASYDGYFIMRTGSACNVNCFLGATGGIEIGKNVLMGPNITILSEEHNYGTDSIAIKEQGIAKTPVKIKDNVWIGSNVVILGGTVIGSGSIIGAGSVVTKSVEENVIIAGNPAKVLKKRDANPPSA